MRHITGNYLPIPGLSNTIANENRPPDATSSAIPPAPTTAEDTVMSTADAKPLPPAVASISSIPTNPTTTAATSSSSIERRIPISSNRQKYDVFISHAGDDKATIALPLREKLLSLKLGISAFVDAADLQPGSDAPQTMIDAMETANVAVIVLSPEFVSRRWPMRELMYFLKRRRDSAAGGRNGPVVIPFFYRLKIEEVYDEPRLDRRDKDGNLLYRTRESKFYERQERGEAEANIDAIKSALMSVRGLTGLTNFVEASNDSSYRMSRKRNMLLEELCDIIERVLREQALKLGHDEKRNGDGESETGVERFRKLFPPLSSSMRAVLDFESKDEDGNPKTTEGLVKRHLLEEGSCSPRIVSLCGIGGVGKSTILEALSVDAEIRQHFRDGVHVIKLGKVASTATLFREVCRVLEECEADRTDKSQLLQNDIEASFHLFERHFERTKCAFLVDDVWMDGVEVSWLSRLCRISDICGNSVLITTREHKIASLAPIDKIVLLNPREPRGVVARRILYFHADHRITDDCMTLVEESITGILDICGGLPVNLAVAGQNVKTMSIGVENGLSHVWSEYLCELVSYRGKLLRENVPNYGNLYETFATSIRILDKRPQEEILGFVSSLSFGKMYRRLCVLQKQAIVPMSMLRHLWETENDTQAKRIARTFHEYGLANYRLVRYEEEYVRYVSMHDSLHEFAVEEAKRNYETKESHEYLIKGYVSLDVEISSKVRGTPRWWSGKMKSDGYIHGKLCRHLLGAGRIAEVINLLLCPEWMKRQIEVNDIVCVEADFSVGMRAVQEDIRDMNEEEICEVREAIDLISQTVSLSSGFISRNVAELSFQLHGRLKRYCESNRIIRGYVSWFETDATRPIILCETSFLREAGSANTRIVYVGSGVSCMIIMKDGERFACGCMDGRIAIVDVKRSAIEKEWKAHADWVRTIAITNDGTRLISCSRNENTVKVWNIETGECVTSFTEHTDNVRDVAVMQDGRRAISGSNNCSAPSKVRVWNIETGQILSEPFIVDDNDVDVINCVAVLGTEEDVVVTGGSDSRLRIWNVRNGAQVGGTFDGHDGIVSCVAVTPNGRYVVSGSSDNTVRVWDVRSQEQIGNPLKGHTREVLCVGVIRDGSRLISGSRDKTIRVWDLESQREFCDPLEGHTSPVTGISFLGGMNDPIVSCSWDGTVRVWNVTRTDRKRLRNRHESEVRGVSFTPDGKFVVSVSWDGTLCIWDTSSGEQVMNALKAHSWAITDVCVTSNGGYIVTVSGDETIRVWDVKSLKLVCTLTGHTHWIRCVAVTPHGRVVTGSDDETVRIWDLGAMDGSHIILEGHRYGVLRVFISDDGLRVVSVDSGDNIFVWELETKKLVRKFEKQDAWSLSRTEVFKAIGEMTEHDNTMLSIPLWGREILYGEGTNQKVLATMESHIYSWTLSRDKKTICVGLDSGQVELMKLET